MKCPIDQTPLALAERQGIEIDYCPTCRGVWLDRGELDKFIKLADSYAPSRSYHEDRDDDDRPRPQEHRERHYDDDDDRHERHDRHGKRHKKESFLGDIFDF